MQPLNQAQKFVHDLYSSYTGRMPTTVGITRGFGVVYPFAFEDEAANPIGFVGCAWNKGAEPDLVQIYHLSAIYQKRGAGTKILRELCERADQYGVTLYVQAQPQSVNNDSDDTIDQDVLVRWYKRFGFTGNVAMQRLALSSEPAKQ